MVVEPSQALGNLPESLRKELLDTFAEITNNFAAGRWEPSELNGGKFCEVVYSILRGRADQAYPDRASKPSNMTTACEQLAHATNLPGGLRLHVPWVLIPLYSIRNRRGVGHVGGDVNPNHMDATVVLHMSKWVMAELVRAFHDVDTRTASATVDLLVEREIPVIWRVGGNRRVLTKGLTLRQQMLLLLYGEPGPVAERDLLAWLEKSKIASTFRRDVLRPAHKDRLVEYDERAKTVTLSPTGIEYVESNLALSVTY